jgi:hypothetical protein
MDAPIRPAVLHEATYRRAIEGGCLGAPFTMDEIEAAAARIGQPACLTEAEIAAEGDAALIKARRDLADRQSELAAFEAMRPGQRLGHRFGYATATEFWLTEMRDDARHAVMQANFAIGDLLKARMETTERRAA